MTGDDDEDASFDAIDPFRILIALLFLCIFYVTQRFTPWIKGLHKNSRRSREKTFEVKDSDESFEFCANLNCLRCGKPSALLAAAREKLRRRSMFDEILLEKMSESIEAAILNQRRWKNGRLYEHPGLESHVFWNCDASRSLKNDIQILESSKREILEEYRQIDCLMNSWEQNRTSSGLWTSFYLVNQGKIVEENIILCPNTYRIVNNLENFLGIGNAFANVVFSVLRPGTKVDAHFGPTNIRLRCHLPLLVPKTRCEMKVDGISRPWVEGKCLLFDDFLWHSAENDVNDDHYDGSSYYDDRTETCDGAMNADVCEYEYEYESRNDAGTKNDLFCGDRVVLLLDLWKPDFNEKEREVLSYAFRRD